jgi:hypothetical protein
MNVRVLVIFILFISDLPLFSQNLIDSLLNTSPQNEYLSSLQFHYGWLWKHRARIKHLPTVYPYAFELTIFAQTKGKKEWHWANNMPRLGIHLLYINLRNSSIYGNALHATPYVDLILFANDNNELCIKLGQGLGFYSNYFHPIKNPQNEIISLPVNFSGTLGLYYKFSFLKIKKYNFLISLNMNHASNATIRQPNLGANILSLSMGIEKKTDSFRNLCYRNKYLTFKKNTKYTAAYFFFYPSISVKQSLGAPRQDVWYPMYNFTFQTTIQLKRKFGITLGFDYTHDESLRYLLKDNPLYFQKKYPIHRMAILLGYEYIYSPKVFGSIQNAYYLYDPYDLDFFLYQRYGLRIFITQHIVSGFFLKSHVFKADGFEVLLGFYLKKSLSLTKRII